MKKVVKSIAALNSQALSEGATVTNKSGQKFNAGGKKSKVVKKAVPKKKQEASKPEQAAIIAEAVEKQTSELKTVLESLKEQMAAIKLDHPEPITAWDFEFIRNSHGITYVKARVPNLHLPRTIN